MTQVISETLEPAGLLLSIGALSGPSFALEVAQGQPTAVTVAFSDPQIAALVQQEFSSETLRLYTSTDVIGVELGRRAQERHRDRRRHCGGRGPRLQLRGRA